MFSSGKNLLGNNNKPQNQEDMDPLNYVADEEADRLLRAERERKKAEVRKRLEEAGRAKKAKKGFLTPERKKKLRKLLMLKATEDLKLQQRKRAEERQKVLNERIPAIPDTDNMGEDDLLILADEFRRRIVDLESDIYDLSYVSRMKDFEINELTIAVNDLRGKFVKPTLKRISKTDTQFDKIKKQNAAKVDYRSTLKTREGTKFTLEDVGETREIGRVDEMIKAMEKRGTTTAAAAAGGGGVGAVPTTPTGDQPQNEPQQAMEQPESFPPAPAIQGQQQSTKEESEVADEEEEEYEEEEEEEEGEEEEG